MYISSHMHTPPTLTHRCTPPSHIYKHATQHSTHILPHTSHPHINACHTPHTIYTHHHPTHICILHTTPSQTHAHHIPHSHICTPFSHMHMHITHTTYHIHTDTNTYTHTTCFSSIEIDSKYKKLPLVRQMLPDPLLIIFILTSYPSILLIVRMLQYLSDFGESQGLNCN